MTNRTRIRREIERSGRVATEEEIDLAEAECAKQIIAKVKRCPYCRSPKIKIAKDVWGDRGIVCPHCDARIVLQLTELSISVSKPQPLPDGNHRKGVQW